MTCGIAGLYNITCQQGATFQRQITWSDPANNPYDLTGYTARMQVRPSKDSPTIIIGLGAVTEPKGTITLGGPAGTIDLEISAANTATLTASNTPYVYDLELVSGGGVVTRVLEGNFKVSAEVTR
jgi:hypothetical protein